MKRFPRFYQGAKIVRRAVGHRCNRMRQSLGVSSALFISQSTSALPGPSAEPSKASWMRGSTAIRSISCFIGIFSIRSIIDSMPSVELGSVLMEHRGKRLTKEGSLQGLFRVPVHCRGRQVAGENYGDQLTKCIFTNRVQRCLDRRYPVSKTMTAEFASRSSR